MSAIEDRWPSKHPELLQLYSINSPNGIKVAAMLEEVGLSYEPHLINLWEDEQHSEEFRTISPNSKIPVITDPDGPDGRTVTMMESGAILLYLAEKTGKMMPSDAIERLECLQWVFFQVAHIGPMFGQFEHFHRRGDRNATDSYAFERYRDESVRLMGVLEARLDDRKFLVGNTYSVADVATFPWVRSLHRVEEDGLPMKDFPRVMDWFDECVERPASQIGLTICAGP